MLGWHSCQMCYPFEIKIIIIIVPPYDLQSRKSCFCLDDPGKNLEFGSFIRDD